MVRTGTSACGDVMMLWMRIYMKVLPKSMEGCLADECYDKATKECCKVEVVWQDAD